MNLSYNKLTNDDGDDDGDDNNDDDDDDNDDDDVSYRESELLKWIRVMKKGNTVAFKGRAVQCNERQATNGTVALTRLCLR